jgi:hypothetical protein
MDLPAGGIDQAPRHARARWLLRWVDILWPEVAGVVHHQAVATRLPASHRHGEMHLRHAESLEAAQLGGGQAGQGGPWWPGQ